jgi:hypothetical protein
VLVVAGLAAAVAGWLLIEVVYYPSLPPVPLLPTLTVAALAVLEAVLAQNTRARIERAPGQPRVDPLAVARYAVLARASSLAGAIFGGFCAGLLAFLLLEPTRRARDDVPATVAGLLASLALVGAALLLERACRVPERPEDDEDTEVSGQP